MAALNEALWGNGGRGDAGYFAGTRWYGGEHLFWERGRWEKMQREAFAAHVKRAAGTDFYWERWGGHLPTWEGLGEVAVTTKDDVARAGSGAFGCGRGEVREWVCTSGTSGKPLQVPLTGGDLTRLAANEAVALGIAGLGAGDTLLMAVGMDRLFVAGLAYWLGAQMAGAACVRAGPQHAASAALLGEMLGRYRPSHVIAVPSFLAAHTGDDAAVLREHIKGLRGIICIGEPIRGVDGELSSLGRRLWERFGCAVLSTYALTETCTTFAEGPGCRGGHLNPQLACVEIVNESGRRAAAGEAGEVVVTPLGVEGLPLVRFRTGDIAVLEEGPCACGRTTPRLGPILGRRQQLLKVRGTSLYPAAILEALAGIVEVEGAVIVATQDHALSDRVAVHLHMSVEGAGAREMVEKRLRGMLRVLPEIVYTDREGIRALQFSGGSRKAQQFLDRRRT